MSARRRVQPGPPGAGGRGAGPAAGGFGGRGDAQRLRGDAGAGAGLLNGATEIRGSYSEISGAHVSEATVLWLQTMAPLTAGDTVELQGSFQAADGYYAADHISLWGG